VRRRSSRPQRGRSFATARLPFAVAGRSRFCASRTAAADRLRPVRRRLAFARPRRRRPRLELIRRDSRPPARPPTSPHLSARLRPAAWLSHSPWARSSNRGISSSSQGRCRAERGGGGGASPLPVPASSGAGASREPTAVTDAARCREGQRRQRVCALYSTGRYRSRSGRREDDPEAPEPGLSYEKSLPNNS